MNNTPRSNRVHIAIFGRRNVGKSSLINALTNQDIALVSHVAGTTTDPVYKAMEILPIGPVLIIDTAGIDDEGYVGELRVKKTREVLNKADIALIVTDLEIGFGEHEKEITRLIKEKNIPAIIVLNKADLYDNLDSSELKFKNNMHLDTDIPVVSISSKKREGIERLKEVIIETTPKDVEVSLLGNIVKKGDNIILVTPIDSSAPKGRMILPQVQTIRAILDEDAFMMVCKETELKQVLDSLKKPPKLVITDSQAFKEVKKIVPRNVPLTSFSILYARYKGDLETLIAGSNAVKKLKGGDKVLVAEGCTHHRQKDDIGTVKIPKWLEKITEAKLEFSYVAGKSFETDLSMYSLIVHCGACMQNRREMMHRIKIANNYNVPIVNYGVFIAYVNGILDRAIEPFITTE
ncbi:MAG: [FeFe] hydrogenase H-cluster maturation GTPase HydF [Clostridiales bacterium]|nr:[FeFe] hydrogenase H-cluster maturation GTPase HydF [Clostridiales bacterium]